jgi:hypothetical protein
MIKDNTRISRDIEQAHNEEARKKAMQEYFSKSELIVINEALFRYQNDCIDRCNEMSNKTGINTNLIEKLKNIATVSSELRDTFEPYQL